MLSEVTCCLYSSMLSVYPLVVCFFQLCISKMGEFKVHRVRFFDYMPSAIRTMAFNSRTERLAVARADGAVEIFNFTDRHFQEKVATYRPCVTCQKQCCSTLPARFSARVYCSRSEGFNLTGSMMLEERV